MQLSEQLARAFTSMGRLINDVQGEELSRPDFLVLVRLPAPGVPAPGADGRPVRSRDGSPRPPHELKTFMISRSRARRDFGQSRQLPCCAQVLGSSLPRYCTTSFSSSTTGFTLLICSRSMNFWIFPVTVIGKASMKRT